MFHFSHPSLLWALGGLAIPVVIHLLSQKDGKVIRMGTLRHLQETSTKQFRGIKLNEILLLIIRSALIIVLVLMISGLEWSLPGLQNRRWVIVEKDLFDRDYIKTSVDSLESKGYITHVLMDGFPILADTAGKSYSVNYPKLLIDLQKQRLDEAIIFSSNKIQNYPGSRIALPKNVKWISDPVSQEYFVLQTTAIGHDSVAVRYGNSSDDILSFTTIQSAKADTLKPTPKDTITVWLAYDPAFAFDSQIIQASLKALNNDFTTINVKEVGPSARISGIATNSLVWLSNKTRPEGFGKTIYIALKPKNEIIEQVSQDEWVVTQHLNEAIALKQNLPLIMASIFLPSEKLNSIATHYDKRVVSDSLAWSPHTETSEGANAGIAYQPLSQSLIVLFMALLMAERLLSYKRNQ